MNLSEPTLHQIVKFWKLLILFLQVVLGSNKSSNYWIGVISVAVGLVMDYIIKDVCNVTDCKSVVTGILLIISAEVLNSIHCVGLIRCYFHNSHWLSISAVIVWPFLLIYEEEKFCQPINHFIVIVALCIFCKIIHRLVLIMPA